MTDDRRAIELRLGRAFADTPDPVAQTARDARVMTTIRSARSRPMPPRTTVGSRAWIGTAVALMLVVVGAGAWWGLGPSSGLLGVGVGASPPSSPLPSAASPTPVAPASPADGIAALTEAQAALDRGRALIADEPTEALRRCRAAWQDLGVAEAAGLDAAALSTVRADVVGCLDTLYGAGVVDGRSIADLSATTPRPGSLVEGPGLKVYLIDDASGSVIRVDPRDGTRTTIIRAGDAGLGQPRLLASAGADLVVMDDAGALWRWRRPTVELRPLPAPRTPSVDDAVAMEAYLLDADRNQYSLSVVAPSAGQIVRYNPADGAGFSDAAAYLADGGPDVGAIRDLVVDTDVYALTADTLRRYFNGRLQDFGLATPPDDLDLRPGHDYRFVEVVGDRFFIHDARWNRILAFDRAGGDYVEQWLLEGAWAGADEVLGLEQLTPARLGGSSPPRLMWLTGSGLFTSTLDDGATGAEGSPAAE